MIFISFSSKDQTRALKVTDYLEKKGIKCWISCRDIPEGGIFMDHIMQAIRDCDGFVVLGTSNSNQSMHISGEVTNAFDMNKPIYPVLMENITFSDRFMYYLRQFQWTFAYDNFEEGMEDLLAAIRGKETVKPKAPAPSAHMQPTAQGPKAKDGNVRIATFQDLTALGMTALDIAKRLVENDYNLYPGMVVENEGEPEQWAEYLSTYPETFRYLINEKNEIIGNWSFLAVSEEIHAEKLAKGELTEETFSIDETEFLLFPGDYIGYLLNLSMNEGYNSLHNLNMLLEAFTDQLLAFAQSGIFFKAWYVNVFRKDHEAMYRKMGFRFLMNNKSFGKLYLLEYKPDRKKAHMGKLPQNNSYEHYGQLMELYDKHFNREG